MSYVRSDIRVIDNIKEREMYTKIYEGYLQSGISYEQLYMLMYYDYLLCFKKYEEAKTEEDEIEYYNKYCNLQTNMKSLRDAKRKMYALSIAKGNLEEKQKQEEIKALRKF